MFIERKRRKPWGWLAVVVIAVSVAALVWAPQFEKEKPAIMIPETIYVNGHTPVVVKLTDNSALKSVRIVLKQPTGEQLLVERSLEGGKEESVEVPLSQVTLAPGATLVVEARDRSWWPLFNGNATIKEANIVVDKTPPYVAVIANSYSIAHGGSALVVVEARDENLKDLAITDGAGHRFELFPFVRNHFYAALIAWPIRAQTFRAQVEGVDAAGNRVAVYIPFFLRSMNYKNSNITIDDKFLNGKIAELAMNEPKAANLDPVSRFKYVNETMRQANEELIYQRAHPKERELISDWSIQPFFPLPNGQVVASFGDHRFFYYGGQQISESWHLGIDLASTQAANVIISNAGKVRFAGYNGIYGNMPLIDHGLGLASLYGHCTTISVKEGDVVRPGQVIATTGVSGLALGDHLHFGLTVQGYEVLPLEWMDARWIKLNVSDVIAQAKIIIAGRPQ